MNVALVHGAWCDGSSWAKVIPLLRSAGHDVIAVQNPLTSLEDDVANTVRFVAELEGDVVLAGHSYGGVVISQAAPQLPNVTALVYIAAYATDAGENLDAINGRFAATTGAGAITSRDGQYLVFSPGQMPAVFAQDVDREEALTLEAVQKPTAIACFATPAPAEPGWKTLPSSYLVSDDDQMINPEAQAFMAERIGARTEHVASSHASPVSHAREVADVILAAAG